MTKAKHSDGRLFLGAALFLLGFIGAFASFYAVASARFSFSLLCIPGSRWLRGFANPSSWCLPCR
jgi:hypothetical protein